jgi:hypothetical protein
VRLFHILQSRLRSILFRDRRESDLSEELQLHLDREIERLEASGLSHEEALLQARRLFGGVEQLKEECRDARGTGAWDALVRDTRQGLRRLVRDWRFTTAAVLILGLAIGANTAIFSVVNAVLFRKQAFADPDRLVNIYQNDRTGRPLVVTSYAAYKEIAEYPDVFAATMAGSIRTRAVISTKAPSAMQSSSSRRRPISMSWDFGRRAAAGSTRRRNSPGRHSSRSSGIRRGQSVPR